MDHTMRPELDNVLQCLLLNGYSVLSLINDIVAHDRNREDKRIIHLREGVERDAADICARVLKTARTLRSAVEEKTREEHGPYSMTDHRLSLQNNFGRVQSKNYRHRATIDVLSDDVFLEIFDFCLRDPTTNRFTNRIEVIQRTKKWQRLVHVCQRWRRIIFASPQRLDLYLSCSYGTPLRWNLHFWPITLPLTLNYPGHIDVYGRGLAPEDEDNVIAALSRHASRVHRIDILGSSSLLNNVATVMQAPFPVLTYLDLTCYESRPPTLPDVGRRNRLAGRRLPMAQTPLAGPYGALGRSSGMVWTHDGMITFHDCARTQIPDRADLAEYEPYTCCGYFEPWTSPRWWRYITWDLKDLPAPFFRGAPVIPGGGLLGGSAPRLQYLRLTSANPGLLQESAAALHSGHSSPQFL
ncbi:hypothetical protein EDB89DRAFT_2155620 [Lactarius sanguifluus]|nr:hypothetical protein EDB89DRAFT_2155620 [Lactarius sanguifluus]